MAGTEAVLEGGARCLLACWQPGGPLIVPLPYWYDGEALWAVTPAGAGVVAALEGGGTCAVHVRSRQGAVVARGRPRVLSLRDPAGLLLRVPAITAVLAALALRDPSALVGKAREALVQPPRWSAADLAILHVRLSPVAPAVEGEPPPGIAPPLPPAVPAAVRRGLAGARRVVVARRAGAQEAGADASVELLPAWWDQHYTLVQAGGRTLAGSEPVAVAVDAEPAPGPGEPVGLVLHGRTRAGVLDAVRATYWRGSGLESVEVPPARADLVLPD